MHDVDVTSRSPKLRGGRVIEAGGAMEDQLVAVVPEDLDLLGQDLLVDEDADGGKPAAPRRFSSDTPLSVDTLTTRPAASKAAWMVWVSWQRVLRM